MTDFNDSVFDFEVHGELKEKDIVTRYVLDSRTANIIIDLNHKYKDKRVNTCVKDYPNVKKLRDALKRFLVKEKGIEDEDARLLAEVIDNNADMLDDGYYAYSSTNNNNGNNTDKDKDKDKEKRAFTAFKYSNDSKIDLHEAVIFAGRPSFLYYDSINHIMKYADAIDEETRIISLCHKESYPYAPYEFNDMDEINAYVNRAKNENVDSLHLQAKQIAADYCDQKDEKVELLAIDIMSSYFQDKLPTTHYDIVLGGNGSGKSSYSGTFTAVGYRVVNLTNPNAANINRILGSLEIGQCTIVSDETGAIDKYPDLMAILKTGYATYMCKTSKINDFSREPEFFYTYCFKMIVSERMPNLRDARGVFDRSFVFTTYKGKPKYDIKETLTPQGIKARLQRLARLNDFRKLMLIYRLLHFKDQMQEVDVGVEGREKELSKPIIQLYYGAGIQPKIEATLQKFLNIRAEKKEITLEPILHPIVTNLVLNSKQKDRLILVGEIWDEIQIAIPGRIDDKKPNEYHTLDYGTIYNNTINSILENTFGGRPKHTRNGNAYIFDIEELERVGRAYGNNVSTTIQTKLTNSADNVVEESNRTLCEGVKAPEALGEAPISKKDENQAQNHAQKDQKIERVPSVEPSQPSHVVTEEETRRLLHYGAYWAGSKHHCKSCKYTDDRFGMIKHLKVKHRDSLLLTATTTITTEEQPQQQQQQRQSPPQINNVTPKESSTNNKTKKGKRIKSVMVDEKEKAEMARRMLDMLPDVIREYGNVED